MKNQFFFLYRPHVRVGITLEGDVVTLAKNVNQPLSNELDFLTHNANWQWRVQKRYVSF